MKSFDYTLKKKMGIHARPAALIADRVKFLEDQVVISYGEKVADASKLIDVIGLGAKQGDTVTVTVEGPDEDRVAAEMEVLFKENF